MSDAGARKSSLPDALTVSLPDGTIAERFSDDRGVLMGRWLRTFPFAVAVGFALSQPAAAQVPLSPEFRVDQSGAMSIHPITNSHSIAVAPDGRFVVTWGAQG